ncbi:MAG: C4-dicarboxylate ABC transporter [Flavobacteriales bacterium TMED288]|nr:C4-dicarboxylate ABC transporter [Flavobacteriales bacterium]RPG53232.1 MAG: C4-dicarboxylate ABC transporter [Flavobacteriales bacterium TMED288]|tara:strand:+ start:11125 stop:12492 length:1368 start_codon:yes stop_codon:yes gene_type:complete
MNFFGPLIALIFISLAVRLLLNNANPHATLLTLGILMIIISSILNLETPLPKITSGNKFLDFFKLIKESFSQTNAGIGLMIMTIGGFVSYIDHIGASSTLVQLSIKPLSIFKNKPHLICAILIPIGQILFICIPSAAGLGLLLMASVFPILTNLGVSRLSAASVITACTSLGVGPASVITTKASEILNLSVINYFIKLQIPVIIPLSLILSVSFYFTNKYFDSKQNLIIHKEQIKNLTLIKRPKIYSIIPLLPLILLISFSELFNFFKNPIVLDTTTAMIISLFIAMVFEFFRLKKINLVLNSLKVFWNGMGNIFKSVVTLIVSAKIFSDGLKSLGSIDALLYLSQNIGLGAIGIAIIMIILIFSASIIMGSGNASFFAFSPLTSKISNSFDVSNSLFILPMNLSASMGRTLSPISGVLIAVSEIAEVSPIDIAKRNFIPIFITFVFLLILNFLL